MLRRTQALTMVAEARKPSCCTHGTGEHAPSRRLAAQADPARESARAYLAVTGPAAQADPAGEPARAYLAPPPTPTQPARLPGPGGCPCTPGRPGPRCPG